MLAAAVAILLLLWPDVSEISIGVVRLKRLIADKAKKTDERVEAVRRDIDNRLTQVLHASQRLTINFGAQLSPDQIREAVQSKPPEPSPLSTTPVADSGTLEPKPRFLVDWALAEAVLDWAERYRYTQRGTDLPLISPILGIYLPDDKVGTAVDGVFHLIEVYGSTLSAARSVRNILAHGEGGVGGDSLLDDDLIEDVSAGVSRFLDSVRGQIGGLLAGEAS